MREMIPPSPLSNFPLLGHWVKLSEKNNLIFFSGRVELGQGNTTALVMMIADELDVLPSSIHLETARTDLTPNEGITAGSMSITIGGVALRWVASALKHQILEIASSFIITVQAPQVPSPQPNLVADKPKYSLSTNKRGVFLSSFTLYCFPLTLKDT